MPGGLDLVGYNEEVEKLVDFFNQVIINFTSKSKELNFLPPGAHKKTLGSIMEKNEEINEVTFEYKISKNYSVYSVNGVHGGYNGFGQLVVNFFNERSSIPRKEIYKIDDDDQLVYPPESSERKKCIIRDIPIGISLTPALARSIGQWLISKADEFNPGGSESE